jgi:hypothetical protein
VSNFMMVSKTIRLALLSLLLIAAMSSFQTQHQAGHNKHQKPTSEHQQPSPTQASNSTPPEPLIPLSALREFEVTHIEALRAIGKQAEAAKVQARTNKETVYALLLQGGLLVVGITYSILAGLQWCAIRRQADATGAATEAAIASHELNEQLFAATHRPRVHVRGIRFDKIQGLELNPLNIRLTVVNRGGRPAKVIERACEILFAASRKVPSSQPPLLSYRNRLGNLPQLLEPGEAYQVLKTREPEEDGVNETEGEPWEIPIRKFNDKDVFLYVRGYIRYKDTLDLTHETAFCRRYDRDKLIFEPVKNPDYEYQE